MGAADCLTASTFNLLLNNLLSLFCCFFIFFENNVTVGYFIYFLFLPVTSLAVLIPHAMRYTLPYRCRPRQRRHQRSRGLMLSIYFACKRIQHHRNSLYPNYHPRTDLNPSLPAFDCWKTHFYSSTSTSAFIDSFDVLKHAHHFADPFIASLPKHYSPEASSTLRRRILFEASHLCSNLDNYGSFKPFCEPFVYTSSIPSELPIVIDTGASNSITPTLTDFTGPLQSPNISSLGSLTSVKKVQFLGTLKMRMVFAAVLIQLLTTYHQLPLGFSRLRSIQRLIKLQVFILIIPDYLSLFQPV